MIRAAMLLASLAVGIAFVVASGGQTSSASPVVVELFTSEGCSSCPPADALLQQLDRRELGVPVIVLSEHVDYWNHIGWTDPYSSHAISERQNAYASHFGIASVYTPQMIVDGTTQFVGNDRRSAEAALERARGSAKIPIRLSAVAWHGPGTLQVHIDAGPLPASGSARADVILAVALDHAESQVLRGENEGRRLTHVAVVLSLTKVGTVEKGRAFSGEVRVKLESRRDLTSLRAIAFVQEVGPGRVLGAAMQQVAGQAVSSQALPRSRQPSMIR